MKDTKKAIIYCRFSQRPDADESKSNEKQMERCVIYCKRKEYLQHGSFCDDAVSGKILNRPGLSSAIAALQPGMVLVVDTRDRLARDMLVSLTIHQQVKERGATVEVADGSPSRDTPEGNLMANILDAFAQYERERFARRTKAGLAKKKASGVWLGKPPIGYKLNRDTKQLEVCSEEKEAIATIMHDNWKQMLSEVIADHLNKTRLCRGKPWSARTIRKIIAREKKNT